MSKPEDSGASAFFVVWKRRGQPPLYNLSREFGFSLSAEEAFAKVSRCFMSGNDVMTAQQFHRRFRNGVFYVLDAALRLEMPDISEEEAAAFAFRAERFPGAVVVGARG